MSILRQNNFFCQEPHFTHQDNLMWEKLYRKQCSNLQDKAFPVFLENIKKFNLPTNKVPSLEDVSQRLKEATGWKVVPVNGLLDHDDYFSLLAEKSFPCVVFVRKDDEENLSKDPDIFHEIFGHCTMLLSDEYAKFLQSFAKFALVAKVADQPLLGRLLWFTTETGLINTENGLRIYGSSILSSFAESSYSLMNPDPIRKPFNIIDIFREPYRADILQSVYYVMDDSQQVYSLLNNTSEILRSIQIARKLGEFDALFPVEYNQYANIGHCVPLKEAEVV